MVTIEYGADPVVPVKFGIIAEGIGGNTFKLNVSFKNDPNEPVPDFTVEPIGGLATAGACLS